MTVDPSGAYFFVANKQSNQISQFKLSSGTGVLTAASPATVSTGTTPAWVAAHTGHTKDTTTTDYLYVPNLGSASISIFSFDTSAGTLSVVGNPVTTGGQPSAIAVK